MISAFSDHCILFHYKVGQINQVYISTVFLFLRAFFVSEFTLQNTTGIMVCFWMSIMCILVTGCTESFTDLNDRKVKIWELICAQVVCYVTKCKMFGSQCGQQIPSLSHCLIISTTEPLILILHSDFTCQKHTTNITPSSVSGTESAYTKTMRVVNINPTPRLWFVMVNLFVLLPCDYQYSILA